MTVSTSKGIYGRLGLGDAGWLGGSHKYYTATADFRFFKNLFWDVVWRNSLQYGRIGATDGSPNDPPFSELYLLGGPYSLRGYRFGYVGQQRFSPLLYSQLITDGSSVSDAQAKAERFYGGQQKAQYMTELMFPMIREASMYAVVFYDIGAADNDIMPATLFADWGFGLRWFSPIGPLRFEWGFPLNRIPAYHENGVFEFSIGTPF